ncbi:MAG: efflux RND transporter periplasmic adaptor subunit [Planctomycetaceae bacterium]|nr:efflux RND transporter periplasmic adaptor subunit [Planctomycetaceae bacterium]
MKRAFVILVVLGVAGGAAAYYANHKTASATPTTLRTVPMKRGDLLSTVSATGTVEAEEVVNIGAQVCGLIVAFGQDAHDRSKFVDYCSVVEKDAILAKIDPTFYEAALEQAEATLQNSEASLAQLEAKFRKAAREWKRAESLLPKQAIADTDYDTAISEYEAAKANVAAGKAIIRQNKASVRTARINLGYCTIKSPVRGTIIERRVNIGQTVVASLNAPSLFLIAKDLSKMQVWASVNEADIGRIRLNMPVSFTVDAHDGQTFRGEVTQIRMNAQMSQNVVTYTVIVTTDNSSGKLLPYMTANVQFEVDKKTGVLLAPNAALRWTPDTDQIDPAANKKSLAAEPAPSQNRGRLWVVTQRGLVRPLEVTVGATDGTTTAVSGKDLKENMQVVAGEADDEEAATTASGTEETNPFMPKPPKGSRPPPGPM